MVKRVGEVCSNKKSAIRRLLSKEALIAGGEKSEHRICGGTARAIRVLLVTNAVVFLDDEIETGTH
jgi:hypothetical protein